MSKYYSCMKNLVFTLIFIFPLIVTAIFITRIIKVDSKLELVKENPVLQGNLKKRLTIDKHASIGCDIKFEDDDNSTYDMEKFKSETEETITEESIGLGADAIEEGSEMYSITQHNQAVTREMTQYSTDAINAGIAGDASRQASRELAADIASRSFRDYGWKNALKGVGLGLGGAVVGFALEQSVNVYENSLQDESILKQGNLDKSDSNNHIGVIATTK